MVRKGGLGRGLGALIPEGAPAQAGAATSFVATEKIVPNPRQPRHIMKLEDLEDLAASIKEHGILQPLLVTHDEVNDLYILIAGERRLRAAQMIGLKAVPVLERQATEQQRLELALIENVQRADLTPLETADAYRQLQEEFNLSQEEIATRVGKSRVAISNTIRLLKLPESVRRALAEGLISEGHARALLGLNTPQAQAATMEIILKQGLTVRQTEELVRKQSGERPRTPEKTVPAPEIRSIEDRLSNVLSTRVTLRHGKSGGSITIHYRSDEDLNNLISQLSGDIT